jgi:hypothetical protein
MKEDDPRECAGDWASQELWKRDAEIERLKKVISLDAVAIGNKNRIITELCDALRESRLTRTGDKCVEFWQGVDVLLQRAREEIR